MLANILAHPLVTAIIHAFVPNNGDQTERETGYNAALGEDDCPREWAVNAQRNEELSLWKNPGIKLPGV